MRLINRRTRNIRQNNPGTTISMTPSSVWLFLVVASIFVSVTHGFSSPLPSAVSKSQCDGTVFKSSATSLFAATTNYPPMSQEEVQKLLDTIPVYAVVEPNQEGLVLVKEPNNTNDIAYFFFNPEAANTVFSPLQKQQQTKGEGADWSVSAYPLGLVWFELINDPEEQGKGVEYRLLPDPEDLIGAQNLLREQQKQSKSSNPKINDLFRLPYNDIPIFVDQFLRVSSQDKDDDRDKVPLYIALKDLMYTCNQAIKASPGDYQAAMSVIDLRDLIDEMTKDEGNVNDYRRAVIVPPSPKSENEKDNAGKTSAAAPPTESDAFGWQGKQANYMKGPNDNEPISTPTASNDWED